MREMENPTTLSMNEVCVMRPSRSIYGTLPASRNVSPHCACVTVLHDAR